MRLRGTSEAVQTADLMLNSLRGIPEAARRFSQRAQPPPIEEVFSGMHLEFRLGCGKRHLETAEVDITRWTKDLKMEFRCRCWSRRPRLRHRRGAETPRRLPPRRGDHADDAQAAAVNNAIFHVEVVPTGDTRTCGSAPTHRGVRYVQFDGPPAKPRGVRGQTVVLPTKLKLPTGKYEIRTVDEGKVVNRQDLEVTPLSRKHSR